MSFYVESVLLSQQDTIEMCLAHLTHQCGAVAWRLRHGYFRHVVLSSERPEGIATRSTTVKSDPSNNELDTAHSVSCDRPSPFRPDTCCACI
ncbi:hypothetical protein J6590_037259 [Homalodisca vitripennis]|nr:hypothetical protein J6590_037259 [Homalodisca vitripennis]